MIHLKSKANVLSTFYVMTRCRLCRHKYKSLIRLMKSPNAIIYDDCPQCGNSKAFNMDINDE